MATLSEMFLAGIQKQEGTSLDSASGAAVGAQLAQIQQQREAQAQNLKQKQAELKNVKFEKLYEFMGNARHYTNAAERTSYLKSATGYRNVLGISPDEVSDEGIMQLAPDANFGRMATLHSMVERQELTAAEALDLGTNPLKRDKFALITPTPPELINKSPDLSAAQKEALDRQQGVRLKAMDIEAEKQKQITGIMTSGQVKMDQTLGDSSR